MVSQHWYVHDSIHHGWVSSGENCGKYDQTCLIRFKPSEKNTYFEFIELICYKIIGIWEEANIECKLYNFRNHLKVYQCIDGSFKIYDINDYDESGNWTKI